LRRFQGTVGKAGFSPAADYGAAGEAPAHAVPARFWDALGNGVRDEVQDNRRGVEGLRKGVFRPFERLLEFRDDGADAALLGTRQGRADVDGVRVERLRVDGVVSNLQRVRLFKPEWPMAFTHNV
jgi:hypothetical protein